MTTAPIRLRELLEPYYVTEFVTSSSDCDACGEGWDLEEEHRHAMFVQREGSSHRTADDLAHVFLQDVAALTTYEIPKELAELEFSYPMNAWLEDPDTAQWLHDEATGAAESALADVGLTVTWDDGYWIERVEYVEECGVCHARILLEVEPYDRYWRELEEDGTTSDSLSYVPELHDHAPAWRILELEKEEHYCAECGADLSPHDGGAPSRHDYGCSRFRGTKEEA